MSNVMMHKFLDSALLWEPAGEDDDSQRYTCFCFKFSFYIILEGILILTVFTSGLSDASIPKSYAENYVLDEIKYTSEDTFSFKLEDLNGKVHRFQSGE